jgi:hypothetical protein
VNKPKIDMEENYAKIVPRKPEEKKESGRKNQNDSALCSPQ